MKDKGYSDDVLKCFKLAYQQNFCKKYTKNDKTKYRIDLILFLDIEFILDNSCKCHKVFST